MSIDLYSVHPYLRVATRSILRAGHEIRRRVLFDYELLYVEHGSFLLTYGATKYRCGEGNFVLLHPGVSHAFSEIFEALSQPHIHFDMTYTPQSPQIPISFRDLDELSPQERGMIARDVLAECLSAPLLHFANPEAAKKLFFEVIDCQKASPLLARARMMELLELILCEHCPDCLRQTDAGVGIAREIKDFLDAEQGTVYSLEDLEKRFSYSRFYLEREFQGAYGMGIVAYRNQRRMERARVLLQSESVSRVAEKLGYSSIYAFSRAFKNWCGVCPSEVARLK